MKQILAGVIGIGFLIVALCTIAISIQKHSMSNVMHTGTKVFSPSPSIPEKSHDNGNILFVPYWTITTEGLPDTTYDTSVYFGIEPTRDGIDTQERGYKTIDTFLTASKGSKNRLLAVRMINTDINSSVLADTNAQKKIIHQTIVIAKDRGFDGIVLDFETSAIAFDSVTKNISNFITLFAHSVHETNLSFYLTAYGDTFYRFRPFDMKTLGEKSDGIMIMAYDLHKAGADAGPNLPLHGKTIYGYDMETMTGDFLKSIPADKLSIIFGMYGYDWVVDEKNQTIETAASITTAQAEKKFVHSCSLNDCHMQRDSASTETEVTYIDETNKKHDVWFEDEVSVEKKKAFLKTKGITSVGYWAYGYF